MASPGSLQTLNWITIKDLRRCLTLSLRVSEFSCCGGGSLDVGGRMDLGADLTVVTTLQRLHLTSDSNISSSPGLGSKRRPLPVPRGFFVPSSEGLHRNCRISY